MGLPREDDERTADHGVLLFGSPADAPHGANGPDEAYPTGGGRSARHRKARRRRRRRSALILTLLLVLLVAGGAYGVMAIKDKFAVKDYQGAGSGTVTVKVKDGDTATAIGQQLLADGVVASVKAFTNAATADKRSGSIQPGAYQLHRQMSGKAALDLMLDPASRVTNSLTLPEGIILPDVEKKLADILKVPVDQVKTAIRNLPALGIPTSYATSDVALESAEGFLWPDTYSFDPGTTPAQALASVVSGFAQEDHKINFAADAQKAGVTPYNALKIASIVESEAKFDEDRPKVARVILNRLAANRRLQVDATSAYAAKLAGDDPSKTIYASVDSPYNSYTHDGLPPTPIGNPGEASLKAAADPAGGDWMFYVNVDAAGHLGFFNNEADFEKAVKACQDNHWGCN